MPELHTPHVEIDTVRYVMPLVSHEGYRPARGPGDEPLQETGGSGGGGAELELGEVRLEEGDLVLLGRARRVERRGRDREVVEELALTDQPGGFGLRDELRATHRLAGPVRGVRQGDLDALDTCGVGWVLVLGSEVHV